LARRLLSEGVDSDLIVSVSAEKGKVIFTSHKRAISPPFYISDGYQKLISTVVETS